MNIKNKYKIMKKYLFLALAGMMLALPSNAQYYSRSRYANTHKRYTYNSNRYVNDVYYGLRLGLAVSTVSSDASKLDGNKSQTGLNLGFAIGKRLSNTTPLYFESGLYYTEKGGKSDDKFGKFTYDLNYLEVPLLVKYVYSIDRDLSIQPFAGGYLACGVGGKIKDYDDRDAFSSYDDGYFNRFDGGLKIGCGMQIQMLYFDLSYDFGLANIGQDDFDDTRNGCFYVNIGVNF
jgi:hypothetical protein